VTGRIFYKKFFIKGEKFMARNERTSKRVASIASQLLRDGRTSKRVKAVAASVLTQRPDNKKKR
jgi:hypothetical protein